MAESGNIRFYFPARKSTSRHAQHLCRRSVFNASSALIRAGIMHRPELDAIGYYGELTIAQNGKVEYSLLGEETEIKESFAGLSTAE